MIHVALGVRENMKGTRKGQNIRSVALSRLKETSEQLKKGDLAREFTNHA